MPAVNGNSVDYSGSYFYQSQIGYSVEYLSDAVARVHYDARLYHSTSLYDSSNNAGGSGDLFTQSFGSHTFADAAAATYTYRSGYTDIARVYGSDVTVTQSMWVEDLADSAGGGARSQANLSIDIAARPYSLPAAVTGLSVTRTSDTSHTIAWTNNPTTGAPYDAVAVERWDNVSNAWTRILTDHTPVSSFVDTTTVANRKYQYRVRAGNSVGDSAWNTSGYVYTTPAAPSSASVSIPSSGTAQVAWAGAPSYGDYQVRIYESVNGAAYALAATVASSVSSWTDTSAPTSQTHQYQVRFIPSSGTVLESGSATTGVVYAVPAAPTAVTAARVSDSQATVSWTRNASTNGPYTSQQVQRRLNGGSWTAVATVSATATAYTDSTIAANGKYEYRVVAVNATGSTASAASSAIWTTPAAPSSATAAKTAAGAITVAWAGAPAFSEYQVRIYESQNGGAYSLLATVAAGSSPYTHASPSTSVTHQYQVAFITSSGTTLMSAVATTGTIQLAAAPSAPTGLGPSTVLDATTARTLSWTHNPVDSSPQSKFQVRHRAAGGSWTEITAVSSTVSQWVLPAGTYANGITVEWQVRTWGIYTDPSAYSATASFVTSAVPTVVVSSPSAGATLTDSVLAAAWTYYQAQGSAQAQWRATLIHGGDTIEVLTGAGTAASVTFATAGADGEAYTIRLEVQSAAGLWSTAAEVAVTVDYLEPSLVAIDAQFHRDSGVMVLTLTPAAWDDVTTIQPVAATVERSLDGGLTWLTIALEVSMLISTAGVVVLDTTVPTLSTVLYRATAISSLPSTAIGPETSIDADERQFAYLSYGPGFGTALVFYGNLELESTAGREEAVEYFAGRVGADGLPAGVIISGETRTRTVTVAVRLIEGEGHATHVDFERAALAGGVMCYRDPSGRRMFGRFTLGGTKMTYIELSDLSFTMEEVGANA
ncbi:fibronectin type III domain-containing protein [Demequina capsici]|uniref:Fibronectin type III domain-containing protein n=1 Tax=Demequina capsici TaxID=3075620 RepID=A0AA96FDG8_9MICO|nr:fibronectin type III domain-containing protein [Demequina sp. PMTSA13]WNM27557.1 fibronectin type III domain-containing protein [Demequina sp. PMTSA13]